MAATAALSTGVLLSSAGPAAAHDGLDSTVPAADSTVTVAPTSVTLNFTGQPQTLEGTALVEVITAGGENLADGAPSIDGGTVTQPLRSAPVSGVVTVRWRIVGTDGHPISDSFTYTVRPLAPAMAPAPTPTSIPSPEPSPTETVAAVTASSGERNDPTRDLGLVAVLAVTGGVFILGAGVVGVLLVRRDRLRRDADAEHAREA
ncbi:copper resistance CopC family protein [Microbacterium sp. MMO-10]|uniref:copper resistance CopC family protein n=1 Tax=Microbacterium sp. MMO-10 TaxID=3081272 RepID=UPI003019896F